MITSQSSDVGGLVDGEYEDNIRVFLRIRPASEVEERESQRMAVQKSGGRSVSISLGAKSDQFVYDAVGDGETCQEDVFKIVGKSISDNCLQGYNGTIFAYGQTGSGKTFTMQGPVDADTGDLDYDNRGVIPRCFEYLFAMMSREEKRSSGCVKFLCRASFCEIYNEFVYDLLDSASPACHIREDIKRGVYVDGITEESVSSPHDTYRLLQVGARNRHVAETSMNRESSRSHSVFTLIIQSKIIDGSISDVRESRFNLVDLAGSERQKSTASSGLRLKEAGNINKSLLALGNVINALVDISHGKSRHINYRDSKLTFLLRDSLGGNAKTFIIANVSPAASCYGETLSSLRFASRAKLIRNRAVVNQEFQGDVIKLQEEIKRLKHELLLSQTHSLSLGGAAGDDFPEMFDGDSKEERLLAIISRIFKRYKASEEIKEDLTARVEAMERVVESQKNQIQSDKMVIKFRDSSIAMLRKKAITSREYLDHENKIMADEIKSLKSIVDFHPEIHRFAAENLELRSSLANYEEHLAMIQDMQKTTMDWKRYEIALATQIIDLTEQLAQLKGPAGSHGAEKETVEANEYVSLKTDFEKFRCNSSSELNIMKQTNANLQNELQLANERLAEAQNEVETLGADSKVLETTIETMRSQSDIQVSASGLDNATFLEKMHSQLTDLKTENQRLKSKVDAFEAKARRLSDFANESRKMSQAQLQDLTERLESVSAENAMKEVDLADLGKQFAELQSKYTSTVSRMGEEKKTFDEKYASCSKSNSDMEQEIVKLVTEAEIRDEQLETERKNFQNAQNELDDSNAMLEFLKHQIEDLNSSLELQKSESSAAQKELAEVTVKYLAQKQELQKVESSMRDNSGVSAQLAETLQEIAGLREMIGTLEADAKAKDYMNRDLCQQRDSLLHDITILKRDLESDRKTISELHSKYSGERQEHLNVKASLSELEEAVAFLRTEKSQIEASLELAQDDNDSLMAQMSELEAKASNFDTVEKRAAVAESKLQAAESALLGEQTRIKTITDNLSQLDELSGENKSLEQQLEYILRRNEELEEANGKLVKHNNFKQKLQYHLQIKQENNQLRMDNQRLQKELEKRQKEDSADQASGGISLTRRKTLVNKK